MTLNVTWGSRTGSNFIDADIRSHCHSGQEDVRGCWVVDATLGKS
jgi:hypothetical protein